VTAYVALLRAVNVGGRQLKMTELKRIAGELGLGSPRTFIASGNLLFTSDKPRAELKNLLEAALTEHMGKMIEVHLRTADEMSVAAEGDPFTDEPGNRVAAIFLDGPPASDSITNASHVADERLALGAREIYVHYPSGMGRSKLKIPAAASGTARNMNSVRKLAELAKEME